MAISSSLTGTSVSDSSAFPDFAQRHQERILAEIPATARIVYLNAPDGSELLELATAWAVQYQSNAHNNPVPPEYQTEIDAFVKASEAHVLARPNSAGHGALIVGFYEGVVDGAIVQSFLQKTPGLPVAFIATVSQNTIPHLYQRHDAVILLPDSLFCTREELRKALGCDKTGDDAWEATGGWPLALKLYRHRRNHLDNQGLALVRQCGMALTRWISATTPELRKLIPQLAYLPEFNAEILRYFQIENQLPTRPETQLYSMGLVIGQRGSESNTTPRLAIPTLMAEAFRAQLESTMPERAKQLQRQALLAMAQEGEWFGALEHAMRVGAWDTAEAIVSQLWAPAAAEQPGDVVVALKELYFRRPRQHWRPSDHYENAELVVSALQYQRDGDTVETQLNPRYLVTSDSRRRESEQPDPAVLKVEPLLTLNVQMMALRLQGQWAAAHTVANVAADRLIHESRQEMGPQTPVKVRQATHAHLWHQIGMTRMLAADVPAAITAFLHARQVSALAGFEELQAESSAHLLLLRTLRATALRHPETESTQPAVSRLEAESRELAAGFAALARLDEDGLMRVLLRESNGFEPSELWPFRFFLGVMHDVLFGNRLLARQRIADQKVLTELEPNALLSLFTGWAEGYLLLLEGQNSRMIELEEHAVRDPSRMLSALRTVGLAARGDYDGAMAAAMILQQDDVGCLHAQALIESLHRYCATIDDPNARLDLRHIIDGGASLSSTLGLWILGVEDADMQRIFGLGARQLNVLRRIRRPEVGSIKQSTPLTDREQEILHHLVENVGRKELAARLHVSLNTVKSHIHSAYRKLGVTNRQDALDEAKRRGYI